MSYRVWIKRDGEWFVYGDYKSAVVAEVHRGLIMDNETRVEVIEDDHCSCSNSSSVP